MKGVGLGAEGWLPSPGTRRDQWLWSLRVEMLVTK